jgi:folate-binding Fe-S cluster repair protein YgfZ
MCVFNAQEDTFLLDYDESVSEDLMKHWKRYKLRMKVKLEDKSDVLSTYATLPALISADDTCDYSVLENELETVLQINSALQDAKDGIAFVDPRGKEFGVRAILPASETCTCSILVRNADFPCLILIPCAYQRLAWQ